MERGARERVDLRASGAVAIDEADAERLGLDRAEVGGEIVPRRGGSLRVVAVTHGARSFTQTPFLFADVATARALLGTDEDAATYWALDAESSRCREEVALALRDAERDVVPRDWLAASTASHWIDGSGIGHLLDVGCILSAVVGVVALLGSTITIVRSHARELATFRALGASRRELAGFVAWQMGLVSVVASVVALGGAAGVGRWLGRVGLVVVVDAEAWSLGLGLAAASTLVAALVGARLVGRLDPRTVLE